MSEKNKKKTNAPSKEEAELAMETIKLLQEKNNEEAIQKKIQEEELAKYKQLQAIQKIQEELAQDKIKKVLRDNLKKKEEAKKNKFLKNFLESASFKKSKITWKSLNNGFKLRGYVDEKLTFEINRGITLFSLYIKDENLKKEKKLPSYLGCSTNLQKLKAKSDKFV